MSTEIPKPEDPKKRVRLKPKQWAEVETLYEIGELNVPELSKRFGPSEDTIRKHFSKRGIKYGTKKKATVEAAKAKIADAGTQEASLLALRIRETKEEHYKMAQNIAALTWKEIVTARNDNLPYATKMNNIKALNEAVKTIALARQERYAALGIDRADYVPEEDLPELVITELTADQIETMRRGNEMGEDGELIEVDIEGLGDDENDENTVVEEK